MNTAFLFPGQGSQRPGMLHDLRQHIATSSCVLHEMSRVLGFDILTLDSERALQSTVAVQLALLASGVLMARTLIESGVVPTTVLGMSVGSFAAAVIAEVISLRNATALVRSRAEQMEHLFSNGYGMAAVVALSETQVRQIVSEVHSAAAPVYVANINAPRQIVISGAVPAIEQVLQLCLAKGAQKAELLDVAVPSHCPLMEPIARSLQQQIASLALRAPKMVYIANVNARAVRSVQAVALDLANNIAHGVRWHDATVVARELGSELFLEMPPGQALSDLLHGTDATVPAYTVYPSTLAWCVRLARREA
jgi:malonate decarboxylase epsilon subunit